MSASRHKKLRQEQAAAAPTTKRQAVTEEEKAARRLKAWTIVFYVVIGLMVIGIALAMAGDWCVKAAILLLRYKAGKWKTFRVLG